MFNIQTKSLAVALALALSSVATPIWAAITLSFNPSANTVNVGNTLSVDVQISGLESAQDLSAFDFNVNFDAAVLGLASYTLGGHLGDLVSFQAIDTSAGNLGSAINLSEISLLWDLSAQPDTFTLATLYFVGNGTGSSALSFSSVTLGDAFGEPLAANLATSSLSVSGVPEPESYAFMLAGLGLLGLIRRKNFA